MFPVFSRVWTVDSLFGLGWLIVWLVCSGWLKLTQRGRTRARPNQASQPTNQPINQATNQPINQSTNQPSNQFIKQPSKQSSSITDTQQQLQKT